MPKDRPEHRIFDSRIVDRMVQRGVIDDKAYEKHLDKLPDLADQADVVTVRQSGRPDRE